MGRLLHTARRFPLIVWLSILVVAIYLFVAVFAPLVAPYGETQVVGAAYEPWGGAFPLGTDNLGRDMLSRLVYGARNTIALTFVITVLSVLIGAGTGLIAAIFGGWVDQLLARSVDVAMSVPALILALLLVSILGNSLPVLVFVATFIEATRIFRVARAAAMDVVVMDYMEDARLRGESLAWKIFREIVPNIIPTLVAEFGLRFCFVVLLISSLSFLGLGMQPPTADWGSMIRDNATLISFGDTTPLLPAAAIGILVVAINLVVDRVIDFSIKPTS
jgi:peptide/nickel transport system permease protein